MAAAASAEASWSRGSETWFRSRPPEGGARIAVVHGAPRRAVVPVVEHLAVEPYDVVAVRIGRSLITELTDLDPDVIVVDYDSASHRTARLCRDLHQSLDVRVIVVAEHPTTDREVIAVLDAGADDFVSNRFSAALLLARLRVAVRSRPAPPRDRETVQVGDVVIDRDAHLVYVAGAPLRLAPLHFLLLEALAAEPNTTVGLDDLMVRVWGADPGTLHPRRLRTAVSLLRKALGEGPHRPWIDTVPHYGYRLLVADAAAEDATSAPFHVA